jgi:hypothetical protein
MRSTFGIFSTLGILLCTGVVVSSGGRSVADPAERVASFADQTRVNVTIYNVNISLVPSASDGALGAAASQRHSAAGWKIVGGHVTLDYSVRVNYLASYR